jgi:hypothetical protein
MMTLEEIHDAWSKLTVDERRRHLRWIESHCATCGQECHPQACGDYCDDCCDRANPEGAPHVHGMRPVQGNKAH